MKINYIVRKNNTFYLFDEIFIVDFNPFSHSIYKDVDFQISEGILKINGNSYCSDFYWDKYYVNIDISNFTPEGWSVYDKKTNKTYFVNMFDKDYKNIVDRFRGIKSSYVKNAFWLNDYKPIDIVLTNWEIVDKRYKKEPF